MASDSKNAVLIEDELLQNPLCSLQSLSTKIFFVGTIISFSIILPIRDVTVILL